MSKSNVQFIQYVNIPEKRGVCDACQICKKKFSIGTREHQCKRCKRAVCESCANFKLPHVKKDGTMSSKPHRICSICKEESDAMKLFITQYQVQYGVDTHAKEWLKEYGQLESASKDYALAKENMNVNIDKVEIAGLDNINFSLKEFYFLAKRDAEKLKTVILSFISKYPEIPFSPELVLLTNFLLCFSSDASAFALLGIIYKHIVPPYFLSTTEYKQEQQMIATCLRALGLKDEEMQLMQGFIARGIRRYISSFTINFFLFETSFYMMSQLIGKYENFIKCIASAMMMSLDVIKKNNYEDFELHMLRNIKVKDLQKVVGQTKLISLSPAEAVLSLNQDQTLISTLRMDISALRLQISLQQNEIEGYKFQLQQQQSPDEKKKDKFIEKKNEEIAVLMQRVEELQSQNRLLLKNEEVLKQENKALKDAASGSDAQAIILEQREKIERLQKQLEVQSLIAVERDSARFKRNSSKSSDMEDQKLVEYKRSFQEEKSRYEEQMASIEEEKKRLREEHEQLKEINRTAIECLSSLQISCDLIEFANKPHKRTNRSDADDIINVIEIKNQQNQLLKQLLKQSQEQMMNIQRKVDDVKLMLQI